MWLEETVSPSASTSGTTRVSRCSARNSGVPLAPLPKRKFSPTDTLPAPSLPISSCSTNVLGAA